MNSFGNIIDLNGINGVKSGKAGSGLTGTADSKSARIDFLQILGGKLSSQMPFMFGKSAASVLHGSNNSKEILSGKQIESLLSALPGEVLDLESGEPVNQDVLVDQNKISAEQFLNSKTAEAVLNNEKLLAIKSVVSPYLDIKAENLNASADQLNLHSGSKNNNPNVNNLNSMATRFDAGIADTSITNTSNANTSIANNSITDASIIGTSDTATKSETALLVKIDKELKARNIVDLKSASLIDKVAGSLNIKEVKVEKNNESSKTNTNRIFI